MGQVLSLKSRDIIMQLLKLENELLKLENEGKLIITRLIPVRSGTGAFTLYLVIPKVFAIRYGLDVGSGFKVINVEDNKIVLRYDDVEPDTIITKRSRALYLRIPSVVDRKRRAIIEVIRTNPLEFIVYF